MGTHKLFQACTQFRVSRLKNMRYVAAYLLAVLGGNETPSANDLKNILESSGVGYDAESANNAVSKLAGKTVAELIEEGSKKMASMPAGGAAPAAGGDAAAAGGDAPAEKKEEKKEESEESDDDMGFGLFD